MDPKFERVNLGKENSLIAFQYSRPSFETPWHFHPQHELTYIQESRGTKFIGDYVGPYAPSELVLIRSNLPHCWKKQSDTANMASSVVVQWNLGTFARRPELDKLFAMLNTASRGILFRKDEVRPLIPEILAMSDKSGQELYLSLLSLLIKLTDCQHITLSEASYKKELTIEHSTRINKVYDFVEKNYQRKLYLKELAQLLHMSEQSFSRFFSRMMGRSFFSFLGEYRVNRSAIKLIDTDDAVAQIGNQSGFDSLPLFYRQFKKHFKSTPLRYRKQYLLERKGLSAKQSG